MSNSVYTWILYMAGKTIPFVIPLLLNSTVICMAGLSVCYLMARRGALIQSWILRVCLVAVILSPITSLISNSSGLTTIRIPVQYPDSPEKVYVSEHNKVSALQLNNSRKDRIDFQDAEKGVATELHDYDGAGNEKRPSESHTLSLSISRLLAHIKDNSFTIYSIFIITWIFFSLYFLIKTVVAYTHFRQIRRTAYPAKPAYITICKSVSKVLGSKEPHILQTPQTQSVFLAGFFHPCIVLPNDGLDTSLATKEIFLHELVHLIRHDYIWNYMCQIGKILLPFQPFIWILIGKMKDTGDYVCDDYVVKYEKDGHSYAVQLYNLAESFQMNHLRDANGVGFVSKLPLRKRIERILDDSLNRHLKLSYPHVMSIIVLFFSSIFITGYVGVKPVDSYRAIKRSVRTIENTLTTQYLKTRAAGLHLRETNASEISHNIAKIQSETPLHKNPQKAQQPQTIEIRSEPPAQVFENKHTTSDEIHLAEFPLIAEKTFLPELCMIEEDVTLTAQTHKNTYTITSPGSKTFYIVDQPDSSIGSLYKKDAWAMGVNSYTLNVNDYSATVSPGPVEINSSTDWENVASDESEHSRLEQLYGNLDKFSNPKWSPDGKWIGFEAAIAMWVVSAEGGEPKPVYDTIGKQIADETGKVTGGETGCWKLLGFSPNSREVTFIVNIFDPKRGSINEMVNLNDYYMSIIYGPVPIIVSVDIRTGERHTIVEESNSGRWSTGGKYFAFQKMNLETNITRQRYYNTHVIKGLGDPEYEEVLYDNLNDGLFVLDRETGAKWLVAEKGTDPCFTPGDTDVIFTMKDATGIHQLFRVPLEGGEIEQLTFYAEDEDGYDVSSPDISPDGQWILHSGNLGVDELSHSGLFVYHVPTGETFQFNKESEHCMDNGVWSPDGKQILYNTVKYPEMTSLGFYIADFEPEDFIKPVVTENSKPFDFELIGNYPNPFNPVTSIKFSLDKNGYTELSIYNIMGQRICELITDELTAGTHSITWNGRDEENRPVSSGVYISRLKMEGKVETLRMTLVK